MRLIGLAVENFLSFERIELKFPDGLVAVCGRNLDAPGASSNGAGKSTIFDAITWALYGRTLRPLGADDVVRRGTSSGGAALRFSIGEQDCLIARTRGARSALTLSVDGQDVTQATVQATQAKIEQLVGLDYKTFCVVVAFNQDALRFAAASDKEQKEILERLLGLEVYADAQAKVRQELSALAAKLSQVEQERAVKSALLARNEQAIKDAENQHAAVEAAKLERQQQAKQFIADGQENIAKLARAKEIAEGDKARLETALAESVSSGVDLSVLAKEVGQKEAEYGAAVRVLQQTLKSLMAATNEKQAVTKRLGKPCGECGRAVTEAELGAVLSKLTTQVSELDALQGEQNRDKQRLHSELTEVKLRYDANAGVQADYEAARREVEAEIRKLTLRLQCIASDVIEYELQIAKAQADLDWKCDTDSFVARLDGLKAEAKQLRLEADECEARKVVLEEDRDYLSFWDRGFGLGGIRSYLLDGVAARISELANAYLSKLTGGTVWIECVTQSLLKSGETRERFEVQVHNQYGAGVYGGNSAGERQRIDVALALALHDLARNRTKNPLEFAIFDELFERLDEAGCDALIGLLKEQRKALGTLFVVTHNPNMLQRFETVLEIIKEQGVSRIAGPEGRTGETAACAEQKPKSSSTRKAKSSTRSERELSKS